MKIRSLGTLALILFAVLGVGAFGANTLARAQENGRVLRAQDVVFAEIAPFVSMGNAWGDRETGAHGSFGLFPGGAESPWHTHSGAYHAVVLSGTMINPFNSEPDPPQMTAGSYWYVPAGAEHLTACVSQQPCVFYFHADGKFDFAPTED